MRINQILFQNNIKSATNKIKYQNSPVVQQQIKIMPSKAHYLSFLGGSSLDLKQSVANLDSSSGADNSKFPPQVKEMAQEVINSGNPLRNTLIDIHKQRYALLNECYDLDDVRGLYDEFANVLSDKDVEYQDSSFISRVKNGEVENFGAEEDLAFQLLKLYWAEGFSLNDLKKYAGTDLYHTMNKLQIPLMDRDYAHVLKFSDREYNERLTSQMAHKRMEARDRHAQLAQGEPVYIPRGPLSDTHKEHISQGLIKHYSEHPEKLVTMSQRQKEYFANNPDQKILMRNAMLFAWNKTQEGRSVKKHLVKFFKKQNVDVNEFVYEADFNRMSLNQRDTLKLFWQKNSWAKQSFSTAVKKGWQQVKMHTEQVQKTIAVNSFTGAMLSLRNEILDNNIPESASSDKDFLKYVSLCIDYILYPDNIGVRHPNVLPKEIGQKEVDEIIKAISRVMAVYEQGGFMEYITGKINTSYELFMDFVLQGKTKEYADFLHVQPN